LEARKFKNALEKRLEEDKYTWQISDKLVESVKASTSVIKKSV